MQYRGGVGSGSRSVDTTAGSRHGAVWDCRPHEHPSGIRVLAGAQWLGLQRWQKQGSQRRQQSLTHGRRLRTNSISPERGAKEPDSRRLPGVCHQRSQGRGQAIVSTSPSRTHASCGQRVPASGQSPGSGKRAYHAGAEQRVNRSPNGTRKPTSTP